MYGKTFTALWEGSMVGKSDAQLVFIFLFCHCDRSGFVEAHPAIVSAKTGLQIVRVKEALAYLEGPDPESRSKQEDGRRIIPLNGDHAAGWKVVNYDYYRGLRKADDRREYQRQYWHKRKHKPSQPHSTKLNRTPPIAEGDVEAKAEAHVEAPRASVPLFDADEIPPLSQPDPNYLTAAQAFDEIFWPEYPRKYKKTKARQAWNALKIKDNDDALLGRIMAALRHDVKVEWAARELDKIPHATSWIHSHRWED